MKKKNTKFKYPSMLIILLGLSFNLGSIAKASEDTDFDSIIVRPSQEVLKLRKTNRFLYSQGVFKYKKINSNSYLIPLDDKTDNEKLTKIKELKNSGLFDLVEPDFKLTIDQIHSSKNYVSISRNNVDNNNSTSIVVNEIPVTDVTTNDSDFKSQYYLKQINATKAWGLSMFDNTILVGILDTGVNSTHPDLQGRVQGDDLVDAIGHGTEVSGIIAANTNNNRGIAAISWNTKVVSIMVTDDNGQARVSTVVSALDRAYQLGVRVVQISLSTNQFSYTLKDAIQLAQDRGILIVTSAGNSGINELRYPAAFEGVIGVGATDRNNNIESYSTRGGHVTLVAPGTSILTTSNDLQYSAVTGTSFSAPQVAGTAALILSAYPDLTLSQLRTVLIQSADDLGSSGKDDDYGYGMINAKKALELAKSL